MQETIVLGLCPVAWRCCVENVAGNQQNINLVLGQGTKQPVQETIEFVVSFAPVQAAAQVPVRGVKQFHEEGRWGAMVKWLPPKRGIAYKP